MNEDKLFRSLARDREKMRIDFHSVVLSIVKRVGFIGKTKFAGPTDTENYLIPVSNIPTTENDLLREIVFSINFETGHITINLTLTVNNQNALWCVQAGAHTARCTLLFEKFTEKTKKGLEDLIPQYLKGDKKALLRLFTFEESVSA